jgi:DNA-binding transcriptional MerR regulator
MEHTYSPKNFSKLVGVSVFTLQRWDRNGTLKAHRTPTNRRYYTHDQYLQYRGLVAGSHGKTMAYARVSSPSQKSDLATQKDALRAYCLEQHIKVDQWIEDIGSALYFARAAGTSRFVWNWALAEWNREYEAGEKPTALKLKKQFNEIRREQFPWTWEVTKNASDQPFLDLGKAFTAFFEGKARRPRFKSKKRSNVSLTVEMPDEMLVLRCRAWQTLDALNEQGRAARWAGGFGGALLSIE